MVSITFAIKRSCAPTASPKTHFLAMAERRLLCTTGRTLRDFNYYNVKILDQKILVIEAEKSVPEYENQKLQEQLDVNNVAGNGYP
jgi:hypothetical protein